MAGSDRLFIGIICVHCFNNIYNIVISHVQCTFRPCFLFDYRKQCNMFMGNGVRCNKLHDAVEANIISDVEYDYRYNNCIKSAYRFEFMHILPVPGSYSLQFGFQCL